MVWSLIGSIILTAALAAWGVRQRRHKAAHTGRPTKPKQAHDGASTGVRAPEPHRERPKGCPVCLSEYPAHNRFCVRDGAALVEGSSPGPFAQGMICPACRRGYPADASFCPEDAEELMPYGLFGAASATRPPFKIDANKICPECGIRHAPSHLFCRQDGTELVVVN